MNKVFRDMTGREVKIDIPPKRIVSLVPSQTELLHDLGLEEEVVGITKFCVHPEVWFRNKNRVGGTKQLHLDKIRRLQPDLILANKEENEKDQIEMLSREFPVWTSDIKTIEDGLTMIGRVGEMVGKKTQAAGLITDIQNAWAGFPKSSAKLQVAYFIWYEPWMVAGGDTFINDTIEKIGWTNVFANQMRYPEVALQTLQDTSFDLILLSSEPFPFCEKHIAEIQLLLPRARVLLVDGEMFSWYGSRMLPAISYFEKLLEA